MGIRQYTRGSILWQRPSADGLGSIAAKLSAHCSVMADCRKPACPANGPFCPPRRLPGKAQPFPPRRTDACRQSSRFSQRYRHPTHARHAGGHGRGRGRRRRLRRRPRSSACRNGSPDLLGKEAALFVPSGSMSNQIGVRVHCEPGDEFICEAGCHIYNYEQGAYAQLSGVAARTVEGDNGVLQLEQLTGLIRPDNDHLVRTRLVLPGEHAQPRGGADSAVRRRRGDLRLGASQRPAHASRTARGCSTPWWPPASTARRWASTSTR